jgi:hypothetical protein
MGQRGERLKYRGLHCAWDVRPSLASVEMTCLLFWAGLIPTP